MRVNTPKRATDGTLDRSRGMPLETCEGIFTRERLSASSRLLYPPAVSEPVKRSAIRRVENADAFPLVALQALRELRDDLERRENAAILRARELGASLEEIAESMGITRQGVAYRIKAMNGRAEHDEDVLDLTEGSAEDAEPRLER